MKDFKVYNTKVKHEPQSIAKTICQFLLFGFNITLIIGCPLVIIGAAFKYLFS